MYKNEDEVDRYTDKSFIFIHRYSIYCYLKFLPEAEPSLVMELLLKINNITYDSKEIYSVYGIEVFIQNKIFFILQI